MSVAGKVALVTGSAQGIGLATVKLLLKGGAKVGLIDISGDDLLKASDDLKKEGYGVDCVLTITCDVTDSEGLVKAFGTVKEKYGSLDIVVNNAGITSEIEWEKLLQINLHAVIRGTKTGIELMSTRNGGKGGVVINMASVAGLMSFPVGPAYGASKTGVIGYTRAMGLAEVTDGVRVNCICPGYVDTAFIPRTEEILKIVEMYLKKQGGWLTPEFVAEGIMKLITDTTLNTQVMRVTLADGYTFQQYNDPMEISVQDLTAVV